MKPLFRTSLAKSVLSAAAVLATAAAAQAAPRQMVLVVAEGVNPQTIEIGGRYVNKAADADDASGLAALKARGASAAAPADALSSLKGLLANARANGYRTGLVTTTDVSKVAPMFYNTAEGDVAALVTAAPFDVLAGGGRASLSAEQRAALGKGNTLFESGEAFELAEGDVRGKLIALQADADLSYAIDRDSEAQAGLADMTSLAIDTLAGANDAPFLLVVHDTLAARALAAKDTPGAFEQFKEIDSVVSDVLSRREEKGDALAVAVLATGGTVNPRAAGDESNALFVVSGLRKSFTGAGEYLKGADDERVTQFAEQDYPGWAVTDNDRAALIAGTLNGEQAVRTAYEPAIGISYETVESTPTLYAIGAPADLASITAFANTKPAAR
jgi:alkaline phosphatase